MPLNGCRCRICRMHSDGAEISRILSAEPKPLDPEHQELLNRIVRDAWEKVRAQEKG